MEICLCVINSSPPSRRNHQISKLHGMEWSWAQLPDKLKFYNTIPHWTLALTDIFQTQIQHFSNTNHPPLPCPRIHTLIARLQQWLHTVVKKGGKSETPVVMFVVGKCPEENWIREWEWSRMQCWYFFPPFILFWNMKMIYDVKWHIYVCLLRATHSSTRVFECQFGIINHTSKCLHQWVLSTLQFTKTQMNSGNTAAEIQGGKSLHGSHVLENSDSLVPEAHSYVQFRTVTVAKEVARIRRVTLCISLKFLRCARFWTKSTASPLCLIQSL